MASALDEIVSVCIYPPIGIARVGNSKYKDGWFYGPEIPGCIEAPDDGFKDDKGAVKRQVHGLSWLCSSLHVSLNLYPSPRPHDSACTASGETDRLFVS